jgi:NAD(P)-dependent dehydrogenase (short-subunit alcohol dehydrogenase family)
MNDHAGGTAAQSPADGPLPMSGRVALVAGASKGIGAATAGEFAAAGAAVVLAARDTAALRSVADGIEARGGRALAVGTDVTDAGSVRHLVERTLETFGRLDAAFNNATAGPMPAPLADIDPDEFHLGTAAEVARAVLWLCSDQSSFITGTVLPIDGGQAAGNKPPHMYRPGQPMPEPEPSPARLSH